MEDALNQADKDRFRIRQSGLEITITRNTDQQCASHADKGPGHGNATRGLHFSAALDAFETRQNVRLTEVTQTPGQ